MPNHLLDRWRLLIDLLRLATGELFAYLLNIRKSGNPNLRRLFPLKQAENRKTLLIVSLTNFSFSVNVEALFAKYFNLQGYQVFFLTNLKERRAVKTFRHINGKLIYHHWVFLRQGLEFLFFKRQPLLSVASAQELKNFCYDGINIGRGVYGAISRKLKVGQLNLDQPEVKNLARRYLLRSILYLESIKDISQKIKPDLILSNEKGYMGSNEIYHWSVASQIDFIQWCGCQDANALIFKRYNSTNCREHPFSVSQDTWHKFLNRPWDSNYLKEMLRFFELGYLGQGWFQWIGLTPETKLIDRESLVRRYGLDPHKKIAVLFAHIMWDANLFFGEDLFRKGFGEWLVESVKVMRENKEINWLIKVHPANLFKHNLEGIQGEYREIAEIKDHLGQVPDNIKIIYPEDNLNPLALFKIIDYGITVRGTIGAELPCFGVTVLTAGTGRYSGRGFTNDSSTRKEYLDKLAALQTLPPLGAEAKRRAILHAYLFFKIRPLVFSSIQEKAFGLERDIDIKITRPEQGTDFLKFVNWAANSPEEDFLNL